MNSPSFISCPECGFGNPPGVEVCLFCQRDLPFGSVTLRLDPATIRATIAEGEADEPDPIQPPAASLAAQSATGEGHILAWLSCHPLALPLETGSSVTIGRGADCDLVLPHREVSRHHAVVKALGDRLQLNDEGSSNGTLINSERKTAASVAIGDRIQVGPYRIDVVAEAATEHSKHAAGATGLALSGQLDEISLAEILQSIEFNKWTGRLLVVTPELQGHLDVIAGAPVRATFGDDQDQLALHAMLRVQRGNFSFSRIPVAKSEPWPMTITGVLLETSRQADELETPLVPHARRDISDRLPIARPPLDSDSDHDLASPPPSTPPAPPSRKPLLAAALALLASAAWALQTYQARAADQDLRHELRSFHTQRARQLAQLVDQTLADHASVRSLEPRLDVWRRELDLLRTETFEHPAELAQASRGLFVLETLLLLARDDFDAARSLANRPEVQEHPGGHLAVQGALQLLTPELPGANLHQAREHLTQALEAGVRRREVREWRLRTLDLTDPDDAALALHDLEALDRTPSGLSHTQRLDLITLLLQLNHHDRAAHQLSLLTDPPADLVWSLTLHELRPHLEHGDPTAALACLRPSLPPPPPSARLTGLRAQDLAHQLLRDLDASLPDRLRAVESLHLAQALGATPFPAPLIDALLRSLRRRDTPLDLLLRAARLLTREPDSTRQRFLVEQFLAMERQDASRQSRFERYLVAGYALEVELEDAFDLGTLLERLRDPHVSAELLLARALARETLGRYDAAAHDLLQAIRILPNRPDLRDHYRRIWNTLHPPTPESN